MRLYFSLFILLCFSGFTCEGSKTPETENAGDTMNSTVKNSTSIDRNKYFIGKTDEVGILIEDNRTHQQDPEFKFEDQDGFINYIKYVKDLAAKHKDESAIEVTFDNYMPEFNRITSLKQGDNLYIATKDQVLEGSVSRYYINIDDEIGSGNMFYAIADLPNALLLQTDQPLICSRDKISSPINVNKITDTDILSNAKKIIEPLVKDVKMEDYSGNNEGEIPVKLADEDFTILKDRESYIVGFNKRIKFDSYTGMMFRMDKNGKITETMYPFTPGDFGYMQLIGIIDLNNDGNVEYFAESGYYEGMGYILYEFGSGKLNEIASGFFFGV
jgi:hypothetical protein